MLHWREGKEIGFCVCLNRLSILHFLGPWNIHPYGSCQCFQSLSASETEIPFYSHCREYSLTSKPVWFWRERSASTRLASRKKSSFWVTLSDPLLFLKSELIQQQSCYPASIAGFVKTALWRLTGGESDKHSMFVAKSPQTPICARQWQAFWRVLHFYIYPTNLVLLIGPLNRHCCFSLLQKNGSVPGACI